MFIPWLLNHFSGQVLAVVGLSLSSAHGAHKQGYSVYPTRELNGPTSGGRVQCQGKGPTSGEGPMSGRETNVRGETNVGEGPMSGGRDQCQGGGTNVRGEGPMSGGRDQCRGGGGGTSSGLYTVTIVLSNCFEQCVFV